MPGKAFETKLNIYLSQIFNEELGIQSISETRRENIWELEETLKKYDAKPQLQKPRITVLGQYRAIQICENR